MDADKLAELLVTQAQSDEWSEWLIGCGHPLAASYAAGTRAGQLAAVTDLRERGQLHWVALIALSNRRRFDRHPAAWKRLAETFPEYAEAGAGYVSDVRCALTPAIGCTNRETRYRMILDGMEFDRIDPELALAAAIQPPRVDTGCDPATAGQLARALVSEFNQRTAHVLPIV